MGLAWAQMNFAQLLILLIGFCSSLAASELRVVSLHPLISDLLRQVGKDKIELVDLIGEKGDPHRFQPRVEDLKAAAGAKIYFVSGMGLEGYLPKLRSILAADVRILEVGNSLPALHGACDHEEHDHEHEIDPHWWHSIDLFRRSTGIIAGELSKELPAEREFFEANAAQFRSQLDELEKWTKREILKIPKNCRKLATAHSAFQYFCDAYGFESFSVQGINREQMPDANELVALIESLKNEQVIAIFPERESNPKMLKSLTRDTGIKLGSELIADGRGVTSYIEMMRSNVIAIVTALDLNKRISE